MKFLLIADKQTAAGFSLAGIEAMVARSKSEALKALQLAIHRNDIGIILITERLAKEIQSNIDHLLCYRKKCHLIMEIPDMDGSLKDRHSVEEFVMSALGIKV